MQANQVSSGFGSRDSSEVVMFVIEDQLHAEPQGHFASFQEAMAELKRRSRIHWDEAPNCAPCASWSTCGRDYEIIEYDDSQLPWRELSRVAVLKISSAGIKWLVGIEGVT